MSKELIDHNADLQRLQREGYELQILNEGHLLIHNVPYVDPQKSIKKGILVSILYSSGGRTIKPQWHVAYFIGDCPCKSDGSKLDMVINHDKTVFSRDLESTNTLSAKADYQDHYEKMIMYLNIIVAQAKVIDDEATARTFQVIEFEDVDSVFEYADTNSTKAIINPITSKLKGHKIAIVGLGGTGSYILDLLAKTPVQQIHLFDDDYFFQHNAFRAPGATPKIKFYEHLKKTDYFKEIYSNMHKYIISHPYNIDATNSHELSDMNFVFISMDSGSDKKNIVSVLEDRGISFVDTGLGLEDIGGFIKGQVRVTTSINSKRDHLKKRVTFTALDEDIYDRNIQIADLNSLNASLAVIKWKKLCGFYKDHDKELHTSYVLYTNEMINDDFSI